MLQTSRSMQSSVAPESIMALIVTDSIPPCSCILTIMWSLSLSMLGVAGEVTYDTGLGLMLDLVFRRRILSRKARDKV